MDEKETKKPKKKLGRGLFALYGDLPSLGKSKKPASKQEDDEDEDSHNESANSQGNNEAGRDYIRDIELTLISPREDQPRKIFNDEPLNELANSIREHGILQPIIVKKSVSGEGYEIIAGERRYRASQMIGVETVPCIIKDTDEDKVFELALLENIQRENLNPLEEAFAYRKLHEEFGYKHEQIAKKIGKSRPYITNFLRIFELPNDVLELLRDGHITMGHAKVLLSTGDPIEIAQKIVAEGLSVRATEKLLKLRAESPKPKEPEPEFEPELEPTYEEPSEESSEEELVEEESDISFEETQNELEEEEEEIEPEEEILENEEEEEELELEGDEEEEAQIDEEEAEDEELEVSKDDEFLDIKESKQSRDNEINEATYKYIADAIRNANGLKLDIKHNPGKPSGVININFRNQEEFEFLVKELLKIQRVSS
jgi:ParB family chromosome partitioning protein